MSSSPEERRDATLVDINRGGERFEGKRVRLRTLSLSLELRFKGEGRSSPI